MGMAAKREEPVTNQQCESMEFLSRHIGPRSDELQQMLSELGCDSFEALLARVVPHKLRTQKALKLSAFPEPLSEYEAQQRLAGLAKKNLLYRSYIGQGYTPCVTPPVIQRNILENPGWYTQYTPYQPEISQGRLEALLNFQTLVAELSGLPIANASLLDEGTAAAEAMAMAYAAKENAEALKGSAYFVVAPDCHPQTIAVVKTRARPLGIEVRVAAPEPAALTASCIGALVQYPSTYGEIRDYQKASTAVHAQGGLLIVAADPLALVLLPSPASFGADIVLGSAQRFGVPMGFGGPHAAFFATTDALKRLMPGRLVGISRDSSGNPALRLSLQTREQHIRRERATSNVCTSQVLLAVMASMYAVYHGPQGLATIALKVHRSARRLAATLLKAGLKLRTQNFFDTVTLELGAAAASVKMRAAGKRINLAAPAEGTLSVTLDECTTEAELVTLAEVLIGKRTELCRDPLPTTELTPRPGFLQQPIFTRYHSETEFQRYIRSLEAKDLSLTGSMIPLGSCTMKLNAAAEMLPISWPEFSLLHPFAPAEQALGYADLFHDLERALAEITGFAACSLQPNAGSQGEYAGLLAIRGYHESRGEGARNLCLIPRSAHGTNPASAVMAGLEVIPVACDERGNVDIADLKAQVATHGKRIACLMVTYPSTHGVFEAGIIEISAVVHSVGAQVYLDGANLNALVGIVRPADLGADVCHINLHKTFCIPHGGGGPGMGPIACQTHLAPFLPGHPSAPSLGSMGPVSAAPWGSASILPIPWMYMAMMAGGGLTRATEVAILSANYIAQKLAPYYPVVYQGEGGTVAHECIIDLRPLKASAGIEVDDVAKRLMDYGFHAPTVSWPVPGTMMVEPTESEPKAELDRFIEAMISIWNEAQAIVRGEVDKTNNVLKRAPHTAAVVVADSWDRPYSREMAAFPSAAVRRTKFWPAVGRIDATYGDRNLVCTCGDVESYRLKQ